MVFGEEFSWCQKARVKLFKEEDNNTNVFHKVANGRRKRNMIKWLEVGDGEVQEESLIRKGFCFLIFR